MWMSATMMIAAVRLELIWLRLAYDIKPQISSMVGLTTSRRVPNRRDPSCRETANVLTYHWQIRATLNEAIMAAQRILFRLRQVRRGIMARNRGFPYDLAGFSTNDAISTPTPLASS